MSTRLMIPMLAAVLACGSGSAPARAQGTGPAVGDPAPAFSLPGARTDGSLVQAIRLEDFRGQTIVLSFFPKARTKG